MPAVDPTEPADTTDPADATDPTEAARYAAFAERGRTALLAGGQTYDRPLGETGRWGVSAVFRPAGEALDRLADLKLRLHAVLPPGHWIHGTGCWHSTLRALEPYRADIPPGDHRIQTYAEALDWAARDLPPFELGVRGLSPHQGGLLLLLSPLDKTLLTLQARYDEALHERNACTFDSEHRRDLWNVGLVHFTGPLAEPERFVAWCDDHRDLDFGAGTIAFDAVDIVRAHPAEADVRLETLHRTALLGQPRSSR